MGQRKGVRDRDMESKSVSLCLSVRGLRGRELEKSVTVCVGSVTLTHMSPPLSCMGQGKGVRDRDMESGFSFPVSVYMESVFLWERGPVPLSV